MSVTIEAKIVDTVIASLQQHDGFVEWWSTTSDKRQLQVIYNLQERVKIAIQEHVPPEKKQRELAERVCSLFLDPRHGPSSHKLHEVLEAWRKLDGTWESQL